MNDYITVIGGGLAGCEAAYASAKKGHKTLLITSNKKNIADIQLGKDSKAIYCLANILDENPEKGTTGMSIYVCKNRKFKEGTAYFSSEEANEGHATALTYSQTEPRTEPIMRNYEEIQWTLNNAPEYDEIICISVDSNGVMKKSAISTELSNRSSLHLETVTNSMPVEMCETKISTDTKFKKILLKIPYEELNISPSDDITFEIAIKPTLENNTFTKEFSLFGSMLPTISTHMYCPIEI